MKLHENRVLLQVKDSKTERNLKKFPPPLIRFLSFLLRETSYFVKWRVNIKRVYTSSQKLWIVSRR